VLRDHRLGRQQLGFLARLAGAGRRPLRRRGTAARPLLRVASGAMAITRAKIDISTLREDFIGLAPLTV
jgi:hypothetical protein